MRVPGTLPRERAKKLLLFDEMRDCVRDCALDAVMTGVRFLLLTKFCEQTCQMTKTQVLTPSKTKMLKKATSVDCQPPSDPKVPKRRRSRTKANLVTVPPCELLLDEHGTMEVAVGERAMPVAFVGPNEEWPLPTELLLLLEPVLQPEVLAEVGHDVL